MRVGTDAVYAAFTLASDAAAHNIDLVVHVACIALFCLAIAGAGLSSNTKEADVANVLGGSVSVISLAYVFHCYFVRGWRRHPNRLLIYRSMADLVSALAVIGFAVAEGVDTGWGARGSPAPSGRGVQSRRGVLLLRVEAWGLVLIHDVVRMIRNPMRAPSGATWRDYHAVVWGASLVYTLLALGPGPWEERKWFEPRGDLAVHREIARNCSASCDNHIHLERLPALTRLPTVNTLPVECWRRYRYEDIPGGTFIAFWWILAFNLLSVVFLVYIARQMAASSHNALRARQAAISRCFSSILVNLSYWAVLYTLCVLSVLPVDPEACSWQHHASLRRARRPHAGLAALALSAHARRAGLHVDAAVDAPQPRRPPRPPRRRRRPHEGGRGRTRGEYRPPPRDPRAHLGGRPPHRRRRRRRPSPRCRPARRFASNSTPTATRRRPSSSRAPRRW